MDDIKSGKQDKAVISFHHIFEAYEHTQPRTKPPRDLHDIFKEHCNNEGISCYENQNRQAFELTKLKTN